MVWEHIHMHMHTHIPAQTNIHMNAHICILYTHTKTCIYACTHMAMEGGRELQGGLDKQIAKE